MRISRYSDEKTREQKLIGEMMNAFAFQFAGEEIVGGHDCWILETRHRPAYQPKDRESMVLIGISGRIWIDKKHLRWAKVQADVVRPVSLWGFLARVAPGTRLLLEQAPINENLWFPKHFNAHVKASVLGLVNEESQEDKTYGNYQVIAKGFAGM